MLNAMLDGRDEQSHRTALAEFIADRGRYPELGDVLERDRSADLGANDGGIDVQVDPEVLPPQRGHAPSSLGL